MKLIAYNKLHITTNIFKIVNDFKIILLKMFCPKSCIHTVGLWLNWIIFVVGNMNKVNHQFHYGFHGNTLYGKLWHKIYKYNKESLSEYYKAS